MIVVDKAYGTLVSAEAGDLVWDDLCRCNREIARVDTDEYGNVAYWLVCDEEEAQRTGCGRFPWELSPPADAYDLVLMAHAERALRSGAVFEFSPATLDLARKFLVIGTDGKFHLEYSVVNPV